MLRVQKVSRGEKHFREFLEKFDYQSFSEGEFITGLLNLLSDETKYIPKNLKGNIFWIQMLSGYDNMQAIGETSVC